MKNINRFIQLMLLVLMIVLASVIPVPIVFYSKDNLPQNLTELVEKDDENEEKDDIKTIN